MLGGVVAGLLRDGFCVLLLVLASCSSVQEQFNDASALTVEHYKSVLRITDDPLETSAVISTVDGFQVKHGLLGIVWSDSFLRGFIDKGTGRRSVQCYVALRHRSAGWRHPYKVNYGSPLRSADVTKIFTDVDCSGAGTYGGCAYDEHVGFMIDADELARVRAEHASAAGAGAGWRFRVKCSSGSDYDDMIPVPELLALLAALDEYRPVPMR